MQATVLKVTGMTCGGCVASVTRVLAAQPGVQNVQVSLERGEASLDYDPQRIDLAQLRRAVEDAGYEAV